MLDFRSLSLGAGRIKGVGETRKRRDVGIIRRNRKVRDGRIQSSDMKFLSAIRVVSEGVEELEVKLGSARRGCRTPCVTLRNVTP